MTPELRRFFDELGPMLMSRRSAVEVEAVLGPSASGTAALAFYAELIGRNLRKIMRDVFPAVRTLATRDGDAAQWNTWVDEYTTAHPPTGGDPNAFAAHFSAWLRAQGHTQSAEIADFEWLRVLTHHAPDHGGGTDGFDRRLFIRQYTFDVPAFVAKLAHDPTAAIPEPRPLLVIVFRDPLIGRVRAHYPQAAGLAAIARRQGFALPPPLASLDTATIDAAETELVRVGVLLPNPA